MSDLSLVPMDDIVLEINKRFDANVILTIKHDKEDIYEFNHHGSFFECLGIAEQFVHCLKNIKEANKTDGYSED